MPNEQMFQLNAKEAGGSIVGSMLYTIQPKNEIKIHNVSRSKRMGLGRQLLLQLCRQAKALDIPVIRFYSELASRAPFDLVVGKVLAINGLA